MLIDTIFPLILYYGKKSMQSKLIEKKKKKSNHEICHVSRS